MLNGAKKVEGSVSNTVERKIRRDGDSIENRLVAIEKMMFLVKIIGASFAIIGTSAGGILWYGYSKLKEREVLIRGDFEALQLEYQKARDNINALKAENSKIFSSALDKYDKMSESYLELRKNVTKASEVAALAFAKSGDLVQSVEQSKTAAEKSEKAVTDNYRILGETQEKYRQVVAVCAGMQETQRALEKYLAKKFQDTTKKTITSFTVDVSGSSSTCTFIAGESIPYSRSVGGSFTDTTIVVPPNSICIVKVRSSFSTIRIKKELQGRVIVENTGSSCDVKYF